MSFLPTVKKNGDFKRIYNRGRSVADRHLVLYFLSNNLEICRFGFIVTKKLGNAVIRNRIRRILREACRLNADQFQQGYDFVLIARKAVTGLKRQQVEESLARLLKRAGFDGGKSR